jgi:hypothetical protein
MLPSLVIAFRLLGMILPIEFLWFGGLCLCVEVVHRKTSDNMKGRYVILYSNLRLNG